MDCGGKSGRALLGELGTEATKRGWDDVVYEISWWTTNCRQEDAACCRQVGRALDAARKGDHATCRTEVSHPVH